MNLEEFHANKRLCALCFEEICQETRKIYCKTCVVCLHFACFSRFAFAFNEIARNLEKNGANDYAWTACFLCKYKDLPKKCYFCKGEEKNYGFFVPFSLKKRRKKPKLRFCHGFCLARKSLFVYKPELQMYEYSVFHGKKFARKKAKIKRCFYEKEANFQEKPHNFLLDFVHTWRMCDHLEAFAEKNQGKSIDELLVFPEKPAKPPSPGENLLYILNEKAIILSNSLELLKESAENLPKKQITIEKIKEKIEKDPLYTFSRFSRDFLRCMRQTLRNRCFSASAYNYLKKNLEFYTNSLILLKNETPDYREILVRQISAQISEISATNSQFRKLSQGFSRNFRLYQNIVFYISGIPEDETVLDCLKSGKTPVKCPENCCCFCLENMGTFSLEKSTWKSDCPNRSQKMECGYQSHKGFCQNMRISLLKGKVLGEDVCEQICWGIDCFCKNFIVKLLANRFSEQEKYEFVQFDLIKALNFQKENGADLVKSLQFIQRDPEGLFSQLSRKIARKTEKILTLGVIGEKLSAHSKGQGLVCINKQGIKANEFITGYYGELYPPWRWFEKQDVIRCKMRETKQSDFLVDFYNIILETHKDDPKGYSLLFVDPIHFGNYSSRLSHSCEPNCGTVSTVSNGNYIIAMYAMKNISYGEELTFDYCSYSEDFRECQKAVCLCGAKNCRGSYLEFSEKREFRETDELLTFVNGQCMVLRACFQQKLTEKQEKTLEKHAFRENIRKNCRNWLEIWIALALELVEQEEKRGKRGGNEENLVLSANIRENRLQNLAISVDKVKHFLEKTCKNAEKKPWTRLSLREIFRFLWGNPQFPGNCSKNHAILMSEPHSIAQELLNFLKNCENVKETREIAGFLTKLSRTLRKLSKNAIKTAIILIKLGFLRVSELFRALAEKYQGNTAAEDANVCNFFGISDILYFYSFTLNFFRKTQYAEVVSSVVNIRKCEVSNQETYERKPENNVENDGKIEFSGRKVYGSDFVWETLINWFKQTEISLKKQVKGVMTYPNLAESFVAEAKHGYPFEKSMKMKVREMRRSFFEKIKKKPDKPWISGGFCKWNYQHFENNIFGSIFLDFFLLQPEYSPFYARLLDLKDGIFEQKFRFFKEFYANFEGIPAAETEKLRKYLVIPSENRQKCDFWSFQRGNLVKTKKIRRFRREKLKKLDFRRKKTQVLRDFSRKDGEISLNSSFTFDFLKDEGRKNLKIEEEIDLS